ncbi:MAG: sugar transferase [Chloroflexota bacterium]|nr:MAG: sugar transferase [Chloroflexota bacterium]
MGVATTTAAVARPRLGRNRRRAKRAVDGVISLALLLLLSPLFCAIALGIRVSSRGPIFFRQRRLKENAEEFTLLKFRTMCNGADRMLDEVFLLNHAYGPLFKANGDPRITPFGRFLRRSFLDELPQLVNVFRGEMSLVGPRPCLPSEALQVRDQIDFRFAVPQGLTGPWQVNGHHALTFDQQLQVEREYIEGWSLSLDFKILLETVPLVFARKGH